MKNNRAGFLGLATAVALALASAGVAKADVIHNAYSSPNTTGNQTNFGGNLGNDFTVSGNIQITGLGAYDSSGDGFGSSTIFVGLYSRASSNTNANPTTGTLIEEIALTGTTATLVSGPATVAGTTSLAGNYRYTALTGTPLVLTAGNYSIVAVGFGPANPDGNVGLTPPFTINTDPGLGNVTYVGSGRFDGNTTLDLPTQSSANQGFPALPPASFAGGSFQFTAVPEPSVIVQSGLLASLGCGLGWFRRRRSA